ncbi:MAG: M15 family metallopeptidase [Eubacteriales bacterium]|nr:M15 family metallopeptidase [Eubacteriales bacterium]
MRVNSNKDIHKTKRDPYKLLIRLTIILAAVVAVGYGTFYLCTQAVHSDYYAKRAQVEELNAQGQQEFDAKLNALRTSANAQLDPTTGEITQGTLEAWEKTLGSQTWRVEDQGRAALENTSEVSLDRSALLYGGMLLINQWHMMPADYTSHEDQLVSIGNASSWKVQVNDGNVRVYPNAYDALLQMVEDAGAEKLTSYIVQEAYRTNDEQVTLFNAQMETLSGKYSGDTLIEQTKKKVNYPGTSEYQSGLSFKMKLYSKTDTALNRAGFQTTEQGKWFTENCWKYGVIFRFPTQDFPDASWEDKSYKTGVTLEMSLYRYVGKAHAAAMRVLGYCLEEYVEFLQDHPHLYVYEDGSLKYEVYRIAVDDTQQSFTVPVPNPANGYTASFDNLGGIVLAYAYN